MLLVVNILIILYSARIAESLECCPVKYFYDHEKIGHKPTPSEVYHHVGYDVEAIKWYGCSTECVYMNDFTGNKYCFAEGEEDYKCDTQGEFYSMTPRPPTGGSESASMMPGTDGSGPPVMGTDKPSMLPGTEPGTLVLNLTTASSGCICPAVYTPVCGLDGVTYSNACSAKCEGNTDKKCEGPCPCPVCTCEPVGQKVCGKDGITYPNEDCATCNYTEVVCLGECPCLT